MHLFFNKYLLSVNCLQGTEWDSSVSVVSGVKMSGVLVQVSGSLLLNTECCRYLALTFSTEGDAYFGCCQIRKYTLILHSRNSFDTLTLNWKNLRQYISAYFWPWLGPKGSLPVTVSSLDRYMPLLAFSRSEFKDSHEPFLIFYLIVLSLKVRGVFYGLLHQRTVAQAFGSLPYLRTAVSVDFTMTISQRPSLRVCVCFCRSVFTRFLLRLVFLGGRQRNYVQCFFIFLCEFVD